MAKKRHYGYERSNKRAIVAWSTVCIVMLVIFTFFITSLCLANAHSLTLVEEWRQWFGIANEAKEPVQAVIRPIVNVFKPISMLAA